MVLPTRRLEEMDSDAANNEELGKIKWRFHFIAAVRSAVSVIIMYMRHEAPVA